MPEPNPSAEPAESSALQAVGARLRERRRALKVSAVATAEAAGMSRVTLHRIERGAPSVTAGAYQQAAAALGLQIGVLPSSPAQAASEEPSPGLGNAWVPVRIALDRYPQLRQLAWQLTDQTVLTPREALDIYERNGRHLDMSALTAPERDLIDALRAAFGDTPAALAASALVHGV